MVLPLSTCFMPNRIPMRLSLLEMILVMKVMILVLKVRAGGLTV